MVNEAKVLALPLKPDDAGLEDDGESAKFGWRGDLLEDVSESGDWDLGAGGMLRVVKVFSGSFLTDPIKGKLFDVSSVGISSAAGIGRPLAAATS